jgi:hypothetical protein
MVPATQERTESGPFCWRTSSLLVSIGGHLQKASQPVSDCLPVHRVGLLKRWGGNASGWSGDLPIPRSHAAFKQTFDTP